MIRAKELSVGNRIWESNSFTPGPDDFEEIVIASINDIDKVIRDNQGNGYSFDALYPIPLTPEWLERCGFDWNPDEQVYSIQIGNTVYLEYDVDFNCSVVPETWRGNPLQLWGDNKFVHKLQNIYYDHTGKELKIKH